MLTLNYRIRTGQVFTVYVLLMVLLAPMSNSFASEQPETSDYLLATGGLGLALGMELFAKDRYLPYAPRFTTPNRLDAGIRNRMLWGSENREVAEAWSDRLIYAVSMSSLLWGPLASKERGQTMLINMEVFSANSLLTNLFKISAGRERPYHYYGTRVSMGKKDYASFYSAHSSIAFSQAVSNAMILSLDYPDRTTLIWSSFLATAGLTAYFRIAGDMHYFSDVLVGSCAGSLLAWTITSWELNRFKRIETEAEQFSLSSRESRREFVLVLKIPLG